MNKLIKEIEKLKKLKECWVSPIGEIFTEITTELPSELTENKNLSWLASASVSILMEKWNIDAEQVNQKVQNEIMGWEKLGIKKPVSAMSDFICALTYLDHLGWTRFNGHYWRVNQFGSIPKPIYQVIMAWYLANDIDLNDKSYYA